MHDSPALLHIAMQPLAMHRFYLLQLLRLAQLVGSPCTLTYDLIIHSWGGAITQAIAIVSILISIWRFGWNNLAEETS